MIRLSLNQAFELERGSVEQWLAGKGVAVTAKWDLAERAPAPRAPMPAAGDPDAPARRQTPLATAGQLAQRSVLD